MCMPAAVVAEFFTGENSRQDWAYLAMLSSHF
jgi:hypothetical protein